jgi:hypothetical protein
MYEIKAYRVQAGFANIAPLSINRDWMDETYNAHAYHCFPVSLANKLGWEVSFPEDIVFTWDGISDSTSDHVKIISGEKYAYTGRANATISFHTGIKFETPKNVTLLTMPVPNHFNDNFQTFTTLMSTSWYDGELPIACRILKPKTEIIIKANTPIAAILPIDLEIIQDSSINFDSASNMKRSKVDMNDYSNTIFEINKLGKWADFYRNAVDHKNNKLGDHQVKKINLNVINDL